MNNFLITKEYERFVEFCDACRQYRYIGLCYGPPGVGKTISARHYSRWDSLESATRYQNYQLPPEDLANCRTVFYTASLDNSVRSVEKSVRHLFISLNQIVKRAILAKHIEEEIQKLFSVPLGNNYVELLIVDESDRLKTSGLEQLRDIYDQSNMGLVLIGMPGIEKKLSRYAQLYSRVGFVHQFKTLSHQELQDILKYKCKELNLKHQINSFIDPETQASIIRITNGNFRLLHRLFTQIERILDINRLNTITKDVVEVAREGLVIG